MSQAASAHILVVEDDRDIAQLLCRIFQMGGYTAAWAPDGRRALEMLEAEQPDLMTLDLNLPEMSGAEVLLRVRAAPSHHALPVVVVTSRDELPRHISALASTVVTKPFEIAGLIAAVAELLPAVSARAVGE